MFRQLPKRLFKLTTPRTLVFSDPSDEEKARQLFRTHPLELAVYLEAFWAGGYTVTNPNVTLGHPNFLSVEPSLSTEPPPSRVPLRDQVLRGVIIGSQGPNEPIFARLRWDHLIYAYMIENTRLYEIFRRVLQNIAMGRSSEPRSMRTRSFGYAPPRNCFTAILPPS